MPLPTACAGIKTAIVSNFDTRLWRILRELHIDQLFDAVIISAGADGAVEGSLVGKMEGAAVWGCLSLPVWWPVVADRGSPAATL